MWRLRRTMPCGTTSRCYDDVDESALITFCQGELIKYMSKFSNELPDASRRNEKGYPWLFFHIRHTWGGGLLVTLVVIAISGAFYLWYSQSGNDTSPDSTAGLGYAVIGTIFFILAALLYSLRRHSRSRFIGP